MSAKLEILPQKLKLGGAETRVIDESASRYLFSFLPSAPTSLADMSGTIEEFDDDTDVSVNHGKNLVSTLTLSMQFALPVSTTSGSVDANDQMAQMQQLMSSMQAGEGSGRIITAISAEAKKWISVYPIYFDAKCKYMKGCRRVAHENSCLWPKSTFIEAAAARLTLMHAHEVRYSLVQIMRRQIL